jgi:hypothetical protein
MKAIDQGSKSAESLTFDCFQVWAMCMHIVSILTQWLKWSQTLLLLKIAHRKTFGSVFTLAVFSTSQLIQIFQHVIWFFIEVSHLVLGCHNKLAAIYSCDRPRFRILVSLLCLLVRIYIHNLPCWKVLRSGLVVTNG